MIDFPGLRFRPGEPREFAPVEPYMQFVGGNWWRLKARQGDERIELRCFEESPNAVRIEIPYNTRKLTAFLAVRPPSGAGNSSEYAILKSRRDHEWTWGDHGLTIPAVWQERQQLEALSKEECIWTGHSFRLRLRLEKIGKAAFPILGWGTDNPGAHANLDAALVRVRIQDSHLGTVVFEVRLIAFFGVGLGYIFGNFGDHVYGYELEDWSARH